MNIQNNLIRVRDIFNKNNVEYMIIGRGAAIIQGYSDTTQDIDIYPNNDVKNKTKLLKSLIELGFDVEGNRGDDILKGKDFIQFKQPFEFDIVFFPDGFKNYQDALKYKKIEMGFPVMNIDGIIKSKKAANRIKDKESIGRLISFKDYLNEK